MDITITRRFLGKINNFIDKGERAFEKAHLKAYINGLEFFSYGRQYTLTGWESARHRVKQKYFRLKNKL